MSNGTQPRRRRPAGIVSVVDDPQARRIAADILQRAARWFIAFHPIGQEHRPSASRAAYGDGVVIRFDPPGVLRVFDARDGELLAESAAGRPHELAPGFVAPERRL